MNPETIQKLYALLEQIPITSTNRAQVRKIKELLDNSQFEEAITELQNLKSGLTYEEEAENDEEDEDKEKEEQKAIEEDETDTMAYPKALMDEELEETYISLLLNDPKSISRYYFTFDDCFFASDIVLNLYKIVLFSDGEAFAPEEAKRGFNFARNIEKIYPLKHTYKLKTAGRDFDFEQIYVNLRKLFILRKNYRRIPIKYIQEKIIDIINYRLYDQMSIEEVESAVSQAEVTSKFKQSILTERAYDFLISGGDNLSQGLDLPFPILSSVFKGIRKGETTSFAMPSNAGKSRFTIGLVAYLAFVHHQKVLVISNEMSEEKMKLCLITTVINNPEIQKQHGYKLKISEGELLELKFRPNKNAKVKLDEEGYIARGEDETPEEFAEKLKQNSKDFCDVTAVVEWLSKQINDTIYFINITDHTNEELSKVIKNYYYKEQIQYVFYDTLKADSEHIGNSEEVKRTATILANLAQNFNIFIGSTMQLAESQTEPLNLNVNDLSASRTVKEVLDCLCLLKQIHNDTLDKYEYSLNEVDTKFFDLEKQEDPNVRYYACVVDKNRAGAKPKVLFRLNLAYNRWEELGYLRVKQE